MKKTYLQLNIIYNKKLLGGFMKNIKVNIENLNKLNGKGIVKRVASLVLVGTMLLGFTGCGKKETVLEESALENAVVAIVDNEGTKEVIIAEHYSRYWSENDRKKYYFSKPGEGYQKIEVYRNLISGEIITDSNPAPVYIDEGYTGLVFGNVRQVEEVEIKGSIFGYLTVEELKNPDNIDVARFLVRIRDQEQAELDEFVKEITR